MAGGVAVLAAVALLGPVPAPRAGASEPAVPAAGEAVPADVGAARAELDRAHEALAALTGQLDEAAAAYEYAQAHHLRLAEELTHTQAAVREADELLAATQADLTVRATGAYRRPHSELALGEAVLVAPDPATALHRLALMRTMTNYDPRVEVAAATRARASERARHQAILDTGTAGSAAELQQRADELRAAAAEAQERLERANARVAAAEAAAQERARLAREAEERAAREREAREREEAERAAAHAAAMAAAGARVVPRSGGICPVGTPNGFIDSWGFPRSGGRTHEGVDIFAPLGTPLYAVTDGTVRRLSNGGLGGLAVHLVDDAGNRFYYAHLDTATVVAGQRVRTGDVIGTVGNTGNARTTPPHLHWQVHPGDGPAANPYALARALCRG